LFGGRLPHRSRFSKAGISWLRPPKDLATAHSSSATPSSSHWWPHESQAHLYFWEDSSVAIAGAEVRPSKTTSMEWHLGQRTGSSSSSWFFSFGVGSSSGS